MRQRKNDDERRTVRVLLGLPRSTPPFPTPLIEKGEAALETPLGDLSNQQLRLLINQGFGLELLIPRALAVLEQDPMIGVTFYEGDLLQACLRAPAAFWKAHAALAENLERIAGAMTIEEKAVTVAYDAFLQGRAETV